MDTNKILIGAKAIAGHALGDVTKARAIYRLEKSGLPVFRLGGTIAARPEKLDAWLAKQEAGSDLEAA